MAVIYPFRCRTCGRTMDSLINEPSPCACGGVLKRDYSSVTFSPSPFQPHFNHAVGMHVSSEREFHDALKIRAEENSLRTGVDHSYAPVLPGEMPAPTTDTDILEKRNRIVHDTHRTDMKVV